MPNMTAHKACAWSVTAKPRQQALTAAEQDGSLTIRMICPQCQGLTIGRVALVVPGPGGYKGPDPGTSSSPGAEARTFFCDCGLHHRGRPEHEIAQGCGAYWKVVL